MARSGVVDAPLRSLVKHTLVYGSGYAATAAVSLVLVPVYTHYLSPSQFGLLALMLVLYGVAKQFYDLGFTNSVGRFFFDTGGGDLRQMRSTSLAFLATYGALLTAALCLFAGGWSRLLTGDPQHGDLVRIVAVTLYAEALTIVPLTLVRMQERSGLFVALTMLRISAGLGLSILFVVGYGWQVRGALLGNALSAVLIMVVLLLDHPNRLLGKLSWDLLRRMLAFGLPFFPVLLAGWLIDASDRYLLELFRSRDEVGFYSLAYRCGQVMQIAVAAFSMGWAPLRYRIYERWDAAQVYRRLTNYYVIAASVLGVGLAVFSDEIVAVAAPASYAPAAGVIPFIVLAYAMQGLFLLTVTGMGVTKKTAPMAWIAGVGAGVNVGLNLIVIPRWGMTGAAATTIAAYAIMVGGSWVYSQRVYPIAFDWLLILRITGVAAAIVFLTALISPASVLGGSACAVAAMVTFICVLVRLGAVSLADLGAARAFARRLRQGLPDATSNSRR